MMLLRMNRKQLCVMLLALLPLFLGGEVRAQINSGYYVITNQGHANYHLHPNTQNNNSNLKVDQGYAADRIWKMTWADDDFYMQNYVTNYYVRYSSGFDAGCVTMTNTNAPGNRHKYHLTPYGGAYGIVPYQYRGVSATQSGDEGRISFNPSGNETGNIQQYRISETGHSRWYFHPVTFGIRDITGDNTIASLGSYTYTVPTTLDIHLDGSAATAFTIEGNGSTFSWSCSPLPAGVTYSASGNTLTLNRASTTGGTITLTCNVTITTTGLTQSVSKTITLESPQTINSLSELMAITSTGGTYILGADIDASSLATSIQGFTGKLDGQYHTITGLRVPLFDRLTGATVKNLVLDNVNLTTPINVNSTQCLGAIAGYADGNTKIYNCGILAKSGPSTISGSDNVGSLVGYITGNTRVVNNYSYANVSGNNRVAGIVGSVEGNALTRDNYATNNHCAVTNNMFYGNLNGSSLVSPVYAGNHTNNIQNVNEYNYWRSRANVNYIYYNNQLAIDKDAFLNRFPFYRHIQNTHRELAAIYLFGSRTDANVAEIGHWYNVKNDDDIPYPIIEHWATHTRRTTVDIAANLPNTTEKYAGKLLDNITADGCYMNDGTQVTTMGTNGYLAVTVRIGANTYTSQLPITDMDTLNYDFTWGKVVLPFANEYDGWVRDYSKICTGWRITSITGGTTGALTNYNFADRECTAKDLYSNSGYIFAQGGNYIVPYGVTAITIDANFANAYYLSDAYYDFGYNADYGGQTNLTTTVPATYHGRTVYTNLNTLMNAMSAATTPHTQAIVLVGNFHYNQNAIGEIFPSYTNKGLTIMSVDEDCNQEPDYGLYTYCSTSSGRTAVPPMRFDFVPNIGIGMAARTTGSTPMPTIGIWHGRGWFELTETCISFMSECEINSSAFTNNDNGQGNNRWIANSGYFIQIVRAREANCTKLSYIQIGGNAYVEELYPGSHTDNARQVTLRPINVMGGEIEECFMTGYKAGATATGGNIRFYAAGGRIHKYLSAYIENPSDDNVNVTAKVDHARIYRFFGGGTSTAARIKGNINVTMNNSYVDFYCGGPEFGDMNASKTVTTNAIGSVFGEYYGAGFGGTSITYNREQQITQGFGDATVPYPAPWTNYKRLIYNASWGIGSCYSFEYILYAGGSGTGVARFYTGYAAFSLAQTGNVTNTLRHCTVLGNFYGGGCQGTVNGTINSTLTDCTLMHNAFGGGYKAASNEVKVYTATQPTYSVYDKERGLFFDNVTV